MPIGAAVVFLLCASALQGGSLAPSKLSVHLLGGTYSPGARMVVQAGPRVLKIFDLGSDMLEAAREYKRLYPKGRVILRVWHTRKWKESDDPTDAADRFWREILEPPLRALAAADRQLIDYLEGPNEGDATPTWFSLGEARWFATFSARLAKRIGDARLRPIVGCVGVGQPGGSDFEIAAKWRAYYPALEAARKAGGGWAYHAYTIAYTTDRDKEQWHSLRYRRLIRIMREDRPDLARMPVFLTEGGVDFQGDAAKDGWQARGGRERFQAWLEWFDRELQRDPQVQGLTLFQSGDPLWPSFELEPILPWLADHLRTFRAR